MVRWAPSSDAVAHAEWPHVPFPMWLREEYEERCMNMNEQDHVRSGANIGGLAGTTDFQETIISIVMPCLNEEAGIARCIMWAREGLERSSHPGEIIVADNGST